MIGFIGLRPIYIPNKNEFFFFGLNILRYSTLQSTNYSLLYIHFFNLIKQLKYKRKK